MTRFSGVVTLVLGLVLGGASPAVAKPDAEDVAKTIVGLAVTAIVVDALRDSPKRKTDGADKSPARIGRGEWVTRRRGDDAVFPERPAKRMPLPSKCRVSVDTALGMRSAYGRSCLEGSYRHAAALPARCETLTRTRHGYAAVYGAACLRREGWRMTPE